MQVIPEAMHAYQRLIRAAIRHADEGTPFGYTADEVRRIVAAAGATLASYQETVCRRRKDNESDDREPLRTRRTL